MPAMMVSGVAAAHSPRNCSGDFRLKQLEPCLSPPRGEPVVLSCGHDLDDTRYRSSNQLPWQAWPRMHTRLAPRSFAISSCEDSNHFLVSHDQLEVSPLSRGILISICPITGQPSLAPVSFARCPMGGPCGPLSSPQEESNEFTMFRLSNTNEVVPAFTPAVIDVRVPRF